MAEAMERMAWDCCSSEASIFTVSRALSHKPASANARITVCRALYLRDGLLRDCKALIALFHRLAVTQDDVMSTVSKTSPQSSWCDDFFSTPPSPHSSII